MIKEIKNKIQMAGLNHFNCSAFKLYGYSTIRQLSNAIKKIMPEFDTTKY